MHDVDPPAPEVSSEADLLGHRVRSVEARHRVLVDGQPARLDLLEELARATQASELELEPRIVEPVRQAHDVALGAADREEGREREEPDPLHGRRRRRPRLEGRARRHQSATTRSAGAPSAWVAPRVSTTSAEASTILV